MFVLGASLITAWPMAPNLQIPKTLATAVKEGNRGISIFFPAKRKSGRPTKTTMETPEETGQATAAGFDAIRRRGRPRKEQQPPSSSGWKRKDPPPLSKDATSPEAKLRRVNWSKEDNRVKLEAALSKWNNKEGGALDDDGEKLSLLKCANIQLSPTASLTKSEGISLFQTIITIQSI
jgi:hypothetical protein